MKNLLMLLLLFSFFNSGLLASIGKIVAAKGDIKITRVGEVLIGKTGTQIEEKDQIKTGKKAKMQVLFSDRTIITIGKNSDFKVEEFKFGTPKTNKASFKFGKGAFRSITGKIGKMSPEKFTLKTKTATIGIRGTQILGQIGNRGGDKIACTQGRIVVASVANPDVRVEVPAGQITQVPLVGAPTAPRVYTKQEISGMATSSGGGGETMSQGEIIQENEQQDKAVEEEQGKEKQKEEGTEEKQKERKPVGKKAPDEGSTGGVSGDSGILPGESGSALVEGETGFGPVYELEPSSVLENEPDVPEVDLASLIPVIPEEVTDTTAPDSPLIDTIGTVTDTATPTISGTAEVDSIVTIIIDGINYKVQTDSNGDWSLTLPDVLANGNYTITATAKDIIGNESGVTTAEFEIAFDSTLTVSPEFPGNFSSNSAYTFDDDDPYTSWGVWILDESQGVTAENVVGGWVSGDMTPSSVIEKYANTNVEANYAGDVKGKYTDGVYSALGEGAVSMNIKFGQANPISGAIDYNVVNSAGANENWKGSFDGSSISGSTFSANISDAGGDVAIDTGAAKGAFYGPGADSVGGDFNMQSGTKNVDGIFVGKK